MNGYAGSFTEKKLNELSELVVKRFSDLSDAVTPTFCLQVQGLQSDTSVDIYTLKKITLSARVETEGQTLSVSVDSSAPIVAGNSLLVQTLTVERGKHTLTFHPSGVLAAKVLIKGATIIENL